jgi:hypothetical protein
MAGMLFSCNHSSVFTHSFVHAGDNEQSWPAKRDASVQAALPTPTVAPLVQPSSAAPSSITPLPLPLSSTSAYEAAAVVIPTPNVVPSPALRKARVRAPPSDPPPFRKRDDESKKPKHYSRSFIPTAPHLSHEQALDVLEEARIDLQLQRDAIEDKYGRRDRATEEAFTPLQAPEWPDDYDVPSYLAKHLPSVNEAKIEKLRVPRRAATFEPTADPSDTKLLDLVLRLIEQPSAATIDNEWQRLLSDEQKAQEALEDEKARLEADDKQYELRQAEIDRQIKAKQDSKKDLEAQQADIAAATSTTVAVAALPSTTKQKEEEKKEMVAKAAEEAATVTAAILQATKDAQDAKRRADDEKKQVEDKRIADQKLVDDVATRVAEKLREDNARIRDVAAQAAEIARQRDDDIRHKLILDAQLRADREREMKDLFTALLSKSKDDEKKLEEEKRRLVEQVRHDIDMKEKLRQEAVAEEKKKNEQIIKAAELLQQKEQAAKRDADSKAIEEGKAKEEAERLKKVENDRIHEEEEQKRSLEKQVDVLEKEKLKKQIEVQSSSMTSSYTSSLMEIAIVWSHSADGVVICACMVQ